MIPNLAELLPGRAPKLEWPGGDLLVEDGDAADRPFLLAGERALAVGRETAGLRRVTLASTVALEGLEVGLPGARRVRVSPGMMERRLEGEARWTERTLVFRRLPGAVLQWVADGDESARAVPETSSLAWSVPLPDGAAVPEAPSPGSPVLDVSTPGGGRVVFVVLPAPARWRLGRSYAEPRGAPSLRVRVRVAREGHGITLLVAGDASDPGAAAPVLRRLDHLAAEVRSLERSGEEGGLQVSTPGADGGRVLAWADARLAAVAGPEEDRGTLRLPSELGSGCPADPRWLWAGHGLLAAGRFRGARRLLAWGADRISGDTASALYAHLAARYRRWTGAPTLPGAAQSAIERIVAGILEGSERLDADSPAATAAAAALSELDAARDRPGRTLSDDGLGAAARRLRKRVQAASRGRRLPVLGGPDPELAASEPDAVGWRPRTPALASIVGVRRPGSRSARSFSGTSGGAGPNQGLGAWATWNAGDPEGAFELWRAHLLKGIRGSPGLWPPPGASGPGGCPLDPGALGSAMASFVFGFLGARADAAFGRLRLAPRIPGAWERFEVRGIRVGDVRVDLRYRGDRERHTFVLAPAAGRVPPNLVFEPLLPLEKIGTVRVDGEAADLERYRTGAWTGVRLQLPLDSVREVIVDGDEHA